MLQAMNGLNVRLQSLSSEDTFLPNRLEVYVQVLVTPKEQKEIEAIVCCISLEKTISAINWKIVTEHVN